MKAMVIHGFGGPDQLVPETLPVPHPDDGEIRIKIAYAGVNPVDFKIREGLLQTRVEHKFPIVLGWDAAGEVVELGHGAKGFHKGDLVYAYCRKPVIQWGCYTEHVVVPDHFAAKKPENLTLAEAASVPLSGLTAWQALFEKARLKKGETVLIHAGAGGVGGFAIQWAKWKGAHVITTAKAEDHAYVYAFGADAAIDYSRHQVAEEVRKMHKDGIDVVFDTVGGKVFEESYKCLKKGGRIVSLLNQPNEELDAHFSVKSFYHFVTPNGSQLQEMTTLFESGLAKPLEIYEFPLVEGGKAQTYLEEGRFRGKIVLKI